MEMSIGKGGFAFLVIPFLCFHGFIMGFMRLYGVLLLFFGCFSGDFSFLPLPKY